MRALTGDRVVRPPPVYRKQRIGDDE